MAAGDVGGIAATEQFTYHDDGRIHEKTDFRGKIWKTIWHSCCGRLQAEREPNFDQGDGLKNGNGVISNNDYFGNVTHTAAVAQHRGHSTFRSTASGIPQTRYQRTWEHRTLLGATPDWAAPLG